MFELLQLGSPDVQHTLYVKEFEYLFLPGWNLLNVFPLLEPKK